MVHVLLLCTQTLINSRQPCNRTVPAQAHQPDRAALAATLLARQLEAQQGRQPVQPLAELLQQPSPISSQAQQEALDQLDSPPDAMSESTTKHDSQPVTNAMLVAELSTEVMWQPDDKTQAQSQPEANRNSASPQLPHDAIDAPLQQNSSGQMVLQLPADVPAAQQADSKLVSSGHSAQSQLYTSAVADAQADTAQAESWHIPPFQSRAPAANRTAVGARSWMNELATNRLPAYDAPVSSAHSNTALAAAAASQGLQQQLQEVALRPQEALMPSGRSTLWKQPNNNRPQASRTAAAPSLQQSRQLRTQPRQGRSKIQLSLSEPEVLALQPQTLQKYPVQASGQRQHPAGHILASQIQHQETDSLMNNGMRPAEHSNHSVYQQQQQHVRARPRLHGLHRHAGKPKAVRSRPKRDGVVVSKMTDGEWCCMCCLAT